NPRFSGCSPRELRSSTRRTDDWPPSLFPSPFGNRLGLDDFDQHVVRRENEKALQLERLLNRYGLHDFHARTLHSFENRFDLSEGEGHVIDRPAFRRLDLPQRRIAPPRWWLLAIRLAKNNELNIVAAKRIEPDGAQRAHVAIGLGNGQLPLRR